MKTRRLAVAAVLVSAIAASSRASRFENLNDRFQEMAAQADLRGAVAAPAAPAGRAVIVPVAAQAPSGDRVALLNEFIAEQLRPFTDAQTSLRLAVTHLSMNATRVVWAAFELDVDKKGPNNEIALAVRNFEYFYPALPNARPTFKGKASGKTDILKFISQDQLDLFASSLDRVIAQLAKSYLSGYGNALALDVKVTDVRREHGHVTGVSFTLDSSVDLSKLPRGTDPQSVLVTKMHITANANIAAGVDLDFSGECNPQAKGFQPGQEGLKEIVDKMLAHDPQAMAQVSGYLKTVNDFAKLITG